MNNTPGTGSARTMPQSRHRRALTAESTVAAHQIAAADPALGDLDPKGSFHCPSGTSEWRKRVVRMASIVYFSKVSEGADEVVYRFGREASDMARTLTMNKVSCRSLPDDGNADYHFFKASRKINAVYGESNAWPEQGMSVS
ncbi:hypothetical protein [Nocardia arizonensis]|uniref:hypothetical protein n=1 Tax=Nocardia arizonensis TaxID=1141647 RepID=UPI0012E205F3|nr:hypothetical protein [Nocardia arizonensis]